MFGNRNRYKEFVPFVNDYFPEQDVNYLKGSSKLGGCHLEKRIVLRR